MGSGRFLALVHSFRRINPASLLEQEDAHTKVDQGLEPTISGRGFAHQTDQLFHNFATDLAMRLQQLQLQGCGGSAHLNWLLDACTSTLSTHSSLFSILQQPTSHRPAFFSKRADEVLSLLDLCTSLKQMTDDVDRKLSLLQQALRTAGQALHTPQRSSTPQSAARRLRACIDSLQFLDNKHYKPMAEAHTALLLAAKQSSLRQVAPPCSDPTAPPQRLNHSLDGTLLISLLMLASTLSSFAAPTSTGQSSTGATHTVCKLFGRYVSKSSSGTRSSTAEATWVAPLKQLQRDLKQEQMGCVFLELQHLQASASSVHQTLILTSNASPCSASCSNGGEQLLRQSIDSLRKSCQDAQACMSELRSHLASLFQALLALRIELLQ